jgi:hypothetical protein
MSSKFEKSDTKGNESAAKKQEMKNGNAKMEMLEGKMHGKMRGSRSKNYKGKSC